MTDMPDFAEFEERVRSPMFETRILATRVFEVEHDAGENVYWLDYLPVGSDKMALARVTFSELKRLEEQGEITI